VSRARIFLATAVVALIAPGAAFAADYDPSIEFEQHPWIGIHLGGLDLSVTKAVAYLWLGAVLTMLLGVTLMRGRGRLTRSETLGELIYDVAETQVAEQGLPHAHLRRWFPYVATLMIFIFVVNLIGFIPLPFGEKWHGVPTFGIYAATSSLSVTLALALMTFVFTHFEGIRFNGPVKYFKSWIPEVPWPMLPLIIPLEILGQFMRLISLSVRLYANMLAGHMLILTFIGLGFVLTSIPIAVIGTLAAALFYLFEVIIVVGIQAFIFAALSAIYIGSAIEPEH
jgi:F-type H+-transporting ATPase subunit a